MKHDFRNSGAAARLWRHKIALLAKAKGDTMRTLKFPLDLTPEQESALPLDQLRTIYNAVEGTGPGSLFAYWACVLLSGFRLFGSGKAASMYRQSAVFDDAEWNAAFQRQSGNDWDWMLPSALIGRLESQPRAAGGKDISWVPESIGNEFAKFLTGKSITDKTDSTVAGFFARLGAAVADTSDVSNWSEARVSRDAVCDALDTFLAAEGLQLPPLGAMSRRLVPSKPDNATLAFDEAAVLERLPQNLPHAVFAMAAARVPEEAGNLSTAVQEEVVTGNASGLSWLFGAGLHYFKSTAIDNVMSDFDVPAAYRPMIGRVIAAAIAVPAPRPFDDKHYGSFRASFGGAKASWIANYANRLGALSDVVSAIPDEIGFVPEALRQPEARELFSGTDCAPEQLADMCEGVRAARDDAKASLHILLGRQPGDVDGAIEAVETLASLIDNLHGRCKLLLNRISRELSANDRRGGNPRIVALCEACAFEMPKWLVRLPAINQLGGGAPAPLAEIGDVADRFNRYRNGLAAHVARITDWCAREGLQIDPLTVLVAKEEKSLQRIDPDRPHAYAVERARRALLSRICKAIINCYEPTKRLLSERIRSAGLFQNDREHSIYFWNQKGEIYRSAFDGSRHLVYSLNRSVLESDWLSWLDSQISDLSDRLATAERPGRVLEDILRLERCRLSLTVSGLPTAQYPLTLAEPDAGIELGVPPALQRQLQNDTVTAETLAKILNLYGSALSGLSFQVFREGFTLKMRFQHEDKRLWYVPKAKGWNPPAHLAHAETLIGQALRKAGVSAGATAIEFAEAIRKSSDELPAGHALSQVPHDWYFDPAGEGFLTAPIEKALAVEKASLGSKFVKARGYRLVGAPSHKTVLDRQLRGGLAEAGVMTLVVEADYRQRVSLDGGRIAVQAEHAGTRLTLAVPVKERYEITEADASMLFDRAVAIDLGERGVGYAVFDCNTQALITSGVLRIPSIRHLVSKTQHYESKPNLRQKFQSLFNLTLSEIRENVAGDVCHQINRLCAYYRGFPILESMVGNGTNAQVKMVYDLVLSRYLFSMTAADKSARSQYWLGAETWVHPYLMTHERGEDGKPSGKPKPLNLFPGAGIGPKGTSQTCSCCRRNPFDLLNALPKNARLPIMNGRLKIDGHELEIMIQDRLAGGEAEARAQMRDMRRQKKRLGFTTPPPNGEYSVDEIRRLLKNHTRRAPTDTRSPDSTQSRYHCAFADCRHSVHAEANAGINIGHKFFAEKVLTPEAVPA